MNIQLSAHVSHPTSSTLAAYLHSFSTDPISAPSASPSSSPLTLHLPPASLLELHGRSSTGKTEFLHHHALHCALPVRLGGEGLRCVVIDCDGRWRAERMAEQVDAAWRKDRRRRAMTDDPAAEDGGGEGEEALWSLRRAVLGRVQVLRVYHPVELLVALRVVERLWEAAQPSATSAYRPPAVKDEQREAEAVHSYVHAATRPSFHTRDDLPMSPTSDRPLLSHATAIASLPLPAAAAERVSGHSPPRGRGSPEPPEGSAAALSLVLIDNVAAFHWTTKASTSVPAPGTATFASLLSGTLQRLLARTGMRCVATKPVLFRSQGEQLEKEWHVQEYMGDTWAALVRYRVLLRQDGEGGCEARVVACREEERDGKRWVKNAILDQRAFVVTADGIVFL